MNVLLGQFEYYGAHPAAVISIVANSLLYPTLFGLVAGLVLVMFECGTFCADLFKPSRVTIATLEGAADEATKALETGDKSGALAVLRTVKGGPLFCRYFGAFSFDARWDQTHAKSLAELEAGAHRTLNRERMLVRLGPLLGLMGTLIPISPALLGLVKGDMETLSSNLIVAYTTTVVGMFIGGLAYMIMAVRGRHYDRDLADIEYMLELLGVSFR